MSQEQKSYIELPLDQYGHKGAPSEWWWHIGTLEAKDGRKFGFEINGAYLMKSHFTQIEITDVSAKKNYQKIHPFLLNSDDWAQYDPTQPWHVKMIPLLTPFDGGVMMQQVGDNPLNMLVQASFTDQGKQCQLILHLNQQQNPPLLVWGTGRAEVNPGGKTPLEKYNYYYSLTNLQASGYIILGTEVIEVTGLTWMDHQYGYFGNPGSGKEGEVHWMLQDMQLSNGVHLSNSYVMAKDEQIVEGKRYKSYATVLLTTGESKVVISYTTAMAPAWTDPASGIVYYMKFKVEIDDADSGIVATFMVNSLLDDQVFHSVDNYEGIGTCEGTFGDSHEIVKGTAWIEQTYGKPKAVSRFLGM